MVAGATGALFRFGMVYGWTAEFELENIRHAHSHLMYFGWGTPALMVLIWRCLPGAVPTSWEHIFRWVAGFTLGAAILAYPPFLLYGYSSVQIGSARLPIAVVGASLNIIGWYGFVALYAWVTWHLPRKGALRLWDLAVGALVLATLGAWGLSLIQPMDLDAPLLETALTHVFLDLFSEGWFVLGALGIAFAMLTSERAGPSSWAVWLVALGLPFTFILGLPGDQLSLPMALAGRVGGALVGVGLLAMTIELLRHLPDDRPGWLWSVPLLCLAGKAGGQLAGSIIPGLWLGAHHGLRILYLHLMLLGFLSLTVVVAAQALWGRTFLSSIGVFHGAVVLVLASLIPLTSWVPGGGAAYEVAAWVALGPVVAAGGLLVRRGIVSRPSVVPATESRSSE